MADPGRRAQSAEHQDQPDNLCLWIADQDRQPLQSLLSGSNGAFGRVPERRHGLCSASGRAFGDQAYAFEELVADISAAILGALLGLPEAQLDNHAAYVATWVKVLKSDKNAILTAASKADEAVDYIVGFGQTAATRIVEPDRPLLVAA